MYKAVLWDFGGGITSRPFEAFNRYELDHALPLDFIRKVNSTNPDENAWAQLESNKISLKEFDEAFALEAKALGQVVRGEEVLALLSGSIRPEMIKALKLIKLKFKIACITNNIKADKVNADSEQKSHQTFREAFSLFDHVIESSKVGIRKPDPKIYLLACKTLGIEPEDAIFLDDLGINLKPARALGMTTIKVLDAHTALSELSALLKMDLA